MSCEPRHISEIIDQEVWPRLKARIAAHQQGQPEQQSPAEEPSMPTNDRASDPARLARLKRSGQDLGMRLEAITERIQQAVRHGEISEPLGEELLGFARRAIESGCKYTQRCGHELAEALKELETLSARLAGIEADARKPVRPYLRPRYTDY